MQLTVRSALRYLVPLMILIGTVIVPAPASAGAPTCGGQTATVVGTSGPDTLTGTSGPDVIVGLDGHDTIDGLDGDDVICGGRGVDTINAGSGADEVWGGGDGFNHGREGDWVMGGAGDDVLHGGNDPAETGGADKHEDIVVYEDAPQGIRITLGVATVTGDGTDTIDGFYSVIGSEHDDVIKAGAETDVVRALGGDDWVKVDSAEGEVFGGDGDDTMRLGFGVYGGKGKDDIRRATEFAVGGPGADLMVGTMQRDNYRGGGGADVLRGRGGNDYLGVSARPQGHDTLFGGAGRDHLQGARQSDRLVGGDGADLLEPGDYVSKRRFVADDVLIGGAGKDTVTYPNAYRPSGLRVNLSRGTTTGVGHDRLRGVENVIGGLGDDTLIGNDRDNVLTGRAGDDTIIGRGGRDHAVGDEGTDSCDAERVTTCEGPVARRWRR